MRSHKIAALPLALLVANCAPAEARKQPDPDEAVIAKGKVLAAYDLKDPASAQFRGIFVSRSPRQSKGEPPFRAPLVCGEINGRNGYGAYAGFHRFAVSVADGWKIMQPDPSDGALDNMVFRLNWTGACGRKWSDLTPISADISPRGSPSPG